MIFRINSRNKEDEDKYFELLDINTYEEIANERTIVQVAQILTGVKSAFEYLDKNIKPKTRELILKDMVNSYKSTYGIKNIYDDILKQLGFEIYLNQVNVKDEIIDL